MAKRDSEKSDELQSKRTKLVEPAAVMNPLPRVCLNEFDCDTGSSYCEDGVDYFCGARANLGIKGGKYCFSAKVVSTTPADQSHSCVIGISRGDCALGELDETMKFSAAKFKSYGKKCDVGETFVCAVDLEKHPRIKIDFFVNGKNLYVGRNLEVEAIKNRESAFFPHVLLKNGAVQFKFSTDDGLVPQKGYEPWAAAILKEDKSYWGPASRNISSEKPLPLCTSSSMQHFKRAPSLTASGLSLENRGVGDHCLGQYSSPSQAGTPNENYYANPPSFESRNTLGFTGSFSDHHSTQINDPPSRAESSTSYRVVSDRSRSNFAESGHIFYGTSGPSQRNTDNLYPLTSALSGATRDNPPAMRTDMYQSDSPFLQGFHGTPSSTTPPSVKSPSDVPREERTSSH